MRELFRKLQVWKRHGQRAPNKPILALWSIGRCINGQPRLARFRLIDKEVGELLREYGPPRVHVRPDYPFWRLKNDGIWEVTSSNDVGVSSSGDALRRDLLSLDVSGGFLEEIYDTLYQDSSLAMEIAHALVQAHFPITQQEEILEATGILPHLVRVPESYQYRRDSRFRRLVLKAYDFQCAVCGFDVRLSRDLPPCEASFALDGAHIQWHQARGPATIKNGLALCALHHRLFDRGAFTLAQSLTVVVAESAYGPGSEEWLRRFAGQPLTRVLDPGSRPDPRFLNWHVRNVFKGSAVA